MEHAQTKRGVHVVDKNKKYTHAQLEDMRGADLRYVQLRSQMEAKVRQKCSFGNDGARNVWKYNAVDALVMHGWPRN